MPLVVAFHAAGVTAAHHERASRLSALADREGFVVVYPEGRRRHWEADAADEAYVRAVIADVARRVPIDERRIYATGVSNGATMAERAACTMSDVFSAVATVAGVYGAATCAPVRPLPVLAIHGARDRLAPIAAAEAWTSSVVAGRGCDPQPATLNGQGISTRAWTGCAAGADVVLDVLWSVGHGWPGDPTSRALRTAPLDAAAAIWAFFAAH